MSRYRIGVLFCLLSALAYGTSPIFTKLAYSDGLPLATMLSGRALIAVPIAWMLAFLTGSLAPLNRTIWAVGVVSVVAVVEVWLFASALARMHAAQASLLFYVYPAIVGVAAVLIGRERFNTWHVTALVITTAGVMLVLSESWKSGAAKSGIALALGAACLYAIGLLAGHALLRNSSPFCLHAWQSTITGAIFFSIAASKTQLPTDVSVGGWKLIFGQSIVVSILAVVAGYLGLVRTGPTTNSVLTTVEVPVTAVLSIPLLGERLSASGLAGGTLILIGAFVVSLHPVPPADTTLPSAGTLRPELEKHSGSFMERFSLLGLRIWPRRRIPSRE
jgi:drug/metabolite transporter (DMT)-like permease